MMKALLSGRIDATTGLNGRRGERVYRILLTVLIFFTLVPMRSGAADDRLKWNKRWGPLVPHKKFPKDCSICHVPKRWDVLRKDFNFDHLKETGYPLLGAHANATCLRCHNDRGAVSAYLSRGCSGCHVDPHKGAMGSSCTKCHEQDAWIKPGRVSEKVAEHARTRFPLTGMHAMLQCQQCHTRADAGEFSGASLDCLTCHQREFQAAPNHVSQGFPSACQNCHNTTTFGPGTVMQHAYVAATPCYSCHASNFQVAPNHIAQNFSHTCTNCHQGTATWAGALFDHSPLGQNLVCYNCHQSEYASAKATLSSNHPANAFPTTCQNCHNTTAWAGTTMQHAFVGGAGATCQTCHMDDYAAATSPVNHASQGIPSGSCNTCHTTFSSWTNFTHNPSNCFNSTTSHSHHNATCAQCHPGASYATASCTACHVNRGNSCN